MALLSDAMQKRISAHVVRPGRASAVANANGEISSNVAVIDVSLGGIVPLNHRARIFVLTKPPSSTIIPNPKIGDIAFVYITDDAVTDNPTGFAMFIYNTTVSAAGAVSGSASWRLVTMS